MITPIDHWRTEDGTGLLMPWYTRPCLEWLETIDFREKRVFEYGCGESTIWYYVKGAISYGVDHDEKWAPKICGYKITVNKAEYLDFVSKWATKFDLVIIDGAWRDDCTEYALQHLNHGGYLIADNFEQPSAELGDWPKTRELTKHLPLKLYKEPTHPDWQTAVWHNV